jgi:ATP-dependent Clp protease ATP-binding subunit ClpX
LRAIVEEALLDVMFDVPSQTDIGRIIVDGDTIRDGAPVEKVPRIMLAERKTA